MPGTELGLSAINEKKRKKENVRLRLGGKPTSVHGDRVQVSGIPLGGAAGDPLLEGEPSESGKVGQKFSAA